MSGLINLNRVVDPTGKLQYREETSTEHFMVKIPCGADEEVDVYFDYDDPKIDKIIFTVTTTNEDGFGEWKTSTGELTPTKNETVYEVWFDHVKGSIADCDYWDAMKYDGYEIYTIYPSDYFEEMDDDDDGLDDKDDKDDTAESDLDQYDSYWNIEKKIVDGEATYNVAYKDGDINFKKENMNEKEFCDFVISLISDDKKAVETDTKAETNSESKKDVGKLTPRQNAQVNSIFGGVDELTKSFDELIDDLFNKTK